jgi:hypothetical protein
MTSFSSANTREIIFADQKFLLDADGRTLYINRNGEWVKWQRFDENTGKFYKMIFVEQGAPPTVEISGIKMHVTQDGNPNLDTKRKLKALGKVFGKVLDTCCGLGYTAIALSELSTVEKVITVERDDNMLALCKENPFSAALFTSPKIDIKRGSSAELIREFPDNYFGGILHDPPRFALSPELYELDFYRECYRVLSAKGKIYHYTGDPNKESRKRSLPEKTAERLREAGFRIAKLSYQGVWAAK